MGTSHVTAGLLVPATTGVTLTTFVQKLSNIFVKVQRNRNYFKIYLFLSLLWFLYVHLIRLAGLTLRLWSVKSDVTKVDQGFSLRNMQLGSQTDQLWEDWLQENRGCLVESRTAGSRCFHDVSSHFPCSKIRLWVFSRLLRSLDYTSPENVINKLQSKLHRRLHVGYWCKPTYLLLWSVSFDFSVKENSWLLLFYMQ